MMWHHLHIDWFRFDPSSAQCLAQAQPRINHSLDVALQTSSEIAEHCRTSWEDDVVVKRAPHIDWTVLDDSVHDLGKRCRKVGIGELKVRNLVLIFAKEVNYWVDSAKGKTQISVLFKTNYVRMGYDSPSQFGLRSFVHLRPTDPQIPGFLFSGPNVSISTDVCIKRSIPLAIF